jgi:hypothetical protein
MEGFLFYNTPVRGEFLLAMASIFSTPRDGRGKSARMPIITIEVPVLPMTEQSFARYGEVFGLGAAGDKRMIASTGFKHEGQVSVGTIFNPQGSLAY